MSEMALFWSAGPYNPTTTTTPIICHFGKISNFISPALDRGYGGEGECPTVSMANSRRKGPTTLSSCRPLDVCRVSEPLWFHRPIVDAYIVDQALPEAGGRHGAAGTEMQAAI